MRNHHRIIIVGGGPAGLATALFIARLAPHLASDMLILEANEHPRPKLCGGGVTFHGEEQLQRLGIEIDVPAFYIDQLEFRLLSRSFKVDSQNAMRIIQRAKFDAALADAVARYGLCLHTGEKLLDMVVHDDGVDVTTSHATYRADVVIGADGAKSMVRRKLRLFDNVSVARLLRVLTPIDPEQNPGWQQSRAVFDFSCVKNGIQGYMWDFPAIFDGQPVMNRGIFDSRIVPPTRQRDNLKQVFLDYLRQQDVAVDDVTLMGHPVRWFNPQGTFSQPRVLLVGDAAGVDSLFAEGISYAMQFGEVAASTVKEAFEDNDFSFSHYREDLLRHNLGRSLMRRNAIAKQLYSYRLPPMWSFLWQMSSFSPARVKHMVGEAIDVLPS